jgi:hypothetical protein
LPDSLLAAKNSRFAHAGTASVLSFANQISDHPVVLSDLEIARSESHQFSPSQSAPDEECENRSIELPAQIVCPGPY